MSEGNVEAVRQIFDAWSRGDFSSVDWADADIEFRTPEFMASRTRRGLDAMRREWVGWLRTFEDFHSKAVEYFDAGDQVVTFNQFEGRGKASGVPMSEIPGAARFVFRGGKVAELQIYGDRKQALRDAGIDPEEAGG